MKRMRAGILLIASLFIVGLSGCTNDTDVAEQEAYRQYGINCIEAGEYANAIDAFQKALDQARGKVTAREVDLCYYKAEAQYLSGDIEGAAATYQALIDYNEDAKSYFLRGCMYFQLGQQEAALKDFGMAASRDSNNRDLYLGIYEAMAANGLETEGEYYLHQALEVSGDKAEDFMQRGRVYYMLSDTQNAIASLEKAIEKGSVAANFYLAETYEEMGDTANADTYFQAYLDAGIANSYDLCEMGVRQMNRGDYVHAISYFQAALALEEVPNHAIILKNMVQAYEAQYDFASAREVLEQYLKLMPEDSVAQKEMMFLSTR